MKFSNGSKSRMKIPKKRKAEILQITISLTDVEHIVFNPSETSRGRLFMIHRAQVESKVIICLQI